MRKDKIRGNKEQKKRKQGNLPEALMKRRWLRECEVKYPATFAYLQAREVSPNLSVEQFRNMAKAKEFRVNNLKRLAEAMDKGIKIFSKIDRDGVKRDYYGFPSTMSIEERKNYLTKCTLLTSRGFFSAGISGEKLPKLPYGTNPKAIKRGLGERNKWIRDRYNVLKNDGSALAEKMYSTIANEVKGKSFGNWEGNLITVETIKKIIYKKERKGD